MMQSKEKESHKEKLLGTNWENLRKFHKEGGM